jgi:hypothetical protein
MDLLQINCHVLSGGNHNPMLMVRVNPYINKVLKSCPTNASGYKLHLRPSFFLCMPGTWAPFPELTSCVVLLQLAENLPFLLTTPLGSIGNSRLPLLPWSLIPSNWLRTWPPVAPLQNFSCGNNAHITENSLTPPDQTQGFTELAISFLHDAQSGPFLRREQVDKLQYAFTGTWQVMAVLSGASYSLEHCGHKGHTNRKHASDLLPYPPKLIPFTLLDGVDTCYSQL